MTTWEHFPNAPIVEAILDLQVSFPAPVEVDRLRAFQDAILDHYPVKEERVQWESEIQIDAQTAQQAIKRRSQGFLFRSQDRNRALQVRQDGFSFNWLKPYKTWEALRDEARIHWDRYREMFKPEMVKRLGLRYINRIELPLPFEDFREYVKIAPEITRELPQGLASFFMRLEIPDEKRHLMAIITETFQPAIDEGKKLPFIFDTDVVCAASFDPGNSEIWEKFEQMREYKNDIFFASMTERAKVMFR